MLDGIEQTLTTVTVKRNTDNTRHVCLTNLRDLRFHPVQEPVTATLGSATRRYSKDSQACPGAAAVMAILHRAPAANQLTDSNHEAPTARPCAKPTGREPSASNTATTVKPGELRSNDATDRARQAVFLHVASVGDCRAVLCRAGRAVVLTNDHTPSVPSERRRVEAAGGFVARDRVNGVLGVSRAFGDMLYKVRCSRTIVSCMLRVPCELVQHYIRRGTVPPSLGFIGQFASHFGR